MKFTIISLALLSVLSADEISRAEAMVDDIAKLRSSYENCQSKSKNDVQKNSVSTCQKEERELKKYKELLQEAQKKNSVLATKIDSKSEKNPNISKEKQIISELEKMLESQNKEIRSLKNSKSAVKEKKSVKVCKDDNKFPKLMMKENSKKESVPKKETSARNEAVTTTKKAFTMRLKSNAAVYNGINGKEVAQWPKDTSFTSNQRTKDWIRVTGYFVDKVWKRADQELWVEDLRVIQR